MQDYKLSGPLRYFVQLSYFGKPYHGWQIQPNALSVQETLNHVFSTLLNEKINLVGAGRTDKGVHAKDMWAHFETDQELPNNLVARANSFLKEPIAIYKVFQVEDHYHTRFDAVSREYEYHITLKKDPFLTDYAWHIRKEPNVQKMQEAANILFEFIDFTSFSKTKTQTRTNNCKILLANWKQEGDRLIFTIKADRFLRNMVRAIVGTLLEVGQEKIGIEDFRQIILAKDRSRAGESAPAHGLFLTKVEYPQNILNGK